MTGVILFLSRLELNTEKWNKAIDEAANGLIYAYSFYLDAVCTNWSALVLNDYEAVMPLPWRKKYGIYYLYLPPFAAQLGVFGHQLSKEMLEAFLNAIPEKFLYWDFPLNFANRFVLPDYPLYQRLNYVLEVQQPYEKLYRNYRANTRRNIKKAARSGCYAVRDVGIKPVLHLARLQATQTRMTKKDLALFENLYAERAASNKAVTYGVYSPGNKLVAACTFLFSHRRAYYILAGNHPDSRFLGASHQLIDAFIQEHAGNHMVLDFEGSDISSLAFFYEGFGAVQENYAAIKRNRLPRWIQWTK